jgi:intracellular sulfur oxidation DsrE/DsrF family protein
MSNTQNQAPASVSDRHLLTPELLEAAALYLVNRRCREAYLHEVRGGLHALYSALELLSRSASAGQGTAAMAERATTIARRAMSNYEPLVLKTIESLTAGHETETEVEFGTLTDEALRFLRTDIANKRLELRAAIDAGVRVRACRETARLWILGLLLTSVDGAPPGGPLDVTVAHDKALGRLVIAAGTRSEASREAESVAAAPGSADAVILIAARRWAESLGGRLELTRMGVAHEEIRVYYPVIATREPEG